MMANKIAIRKLRERFVYNRETGLIIATTSWGRRHAGEEAGYRSELGYRYVGICGKSFFAHRVAWAMTYGRWPTKEIDHINGIKDDNRIANLRQATRAENSGNIRKPYSTNTTGFLGVFVCRSWKYPKPYRAKIRANGKTIYLGYFLTASEASAAYMNAKKKLHKTAAICLEIKP